MYSQLLLVILIGAPDSAGSHHHRLRLPQMEVALFPVVSAGSRNAPRVQQQAEHGALHVDLHAAVNAVVLQGADHLQAGAIANVRQPRILMPAEVSLQNAAVLGAVEECAPRLQFAHTFRRFLGVQLRHAPVVQVLPAAHGIGEMNAPVVAIVDIGQSRGNTALGHHGVRFAQQRFADHANFGAVGSGFDRGAQTGPTRTDDQNVIGVAMEFRHLQDSPVVPDPHRAEADVDIRKSHPKQTSPRPLLMPCIQAAHAVVELMPYRVFRDLIERAADQVAEGVAAEYIPAEKHNVHHQDDAPDPDPEAVRKAEAHDRVVNQKGPNQVGEPQEVAMEILQDQRKASFAEITLARLADRTRRRIGPERLVIGAAVVVAGEPERGLESTG